MPVSVCGERREDLTFVLFKMPINKNVELNIAGGINLVQPLNVETAIACLCSLNSEEKSASLQSYILIDVQKLSRNLKKISIVFN